MVIELWNVTNQQFGKWGVWKQVFDLKNGYEMIRKIWL